MKERIRELAEQAGYDYDGYDPFGLFDEEKFAELIVRDCVEKIVTYQIPVGNSAVGEMACELTYTSLKELRDDIKHHFGIEGE